MLTKDDLKNIRGAIQEENGNLETKLRKIIREEINGSETKLHKVIHEEIETLETKMELRFDKQDKQMEQDRKDWSEFFNLAGIFFDDMRNQLVNRIKKLEDNQRVSKN